MATFDINAFLSSRYENSGKTAQKLDEIVRAKEQKGAEIIASSEKVKFELDPFSNSWATKLGLDPESIPGTVVNTAANVTAGASRLLSNTATAGLDLVALGNDKALKDAEVQAYQRATQGTATEEDLALLKQPDANGTTPIDRLRLAGNLRKTASGISDAMDLTSIVHGKEKADLTKALGNAYDRDGAQLEGGLTDLANGEILRGAKDAILGAGKLAAGGLQSVLRNPKGTFEYVAENVPQLAVGAMGKTGSAVMAASNAGYGVENYRKGIEEFQKANNGALPSKEEMDKMALWAAAASGAEHIADLAVLKGMSPKGAAKAAEDVVKAADKAVDRVGFKQAIMNSVKAVGGASAEEGATEGFQTFAENNAQLKDTTGKEVFTSAVIGAASGGAMTGATRVPQELVQPFKVDPNAPAKPKPQTAVEREALMAAIETGDASNYADPTKDTFDATQAMKVLVGNSRLETTTPEARKENLAKANQVFLDHGNKMDELEASLPETKDQYAQRIEEAKAALAALPADADPQQRAELEAEQATAERLLAVPVGTEAEQAQVVERLDKMKKEQDSLVNQIVTLSNENKKAASAVQSADPKVEIQAAVTAAKDMTDLETSKAAASKVMILSMASPEALDPADAMALANDRNNGLSTDQREYLRALSDARIERNKAQKMSNVSQEILFGDKAGTQIGLATYERRAALALESNNLPLVDRQIEGLTKFAQSHEGKSAAVQQAWEEHQKTGDSYQVLRTKNGDWTIALQTLSINQIKQNGGLWIGRNSANIVPAVAQEAKAIASTLAMVKQAKIAHATTTSAVQTNAQAAPITAAQPTAQPVTAATVAAVQEATPTAAPASTSPVAANPTSTPVSGTGNTPVETAGVKIPAAIKRMSDEMLNDALNNAMAKPGYQKSVLFQQLDAEMTLRENTATSQAKAEATSVAEKPVAQAKVQDQNTIKKETPKEQAATASNTLEDAVKIDQPATEVPATEQVNQETIQEDGRLSVFTTIDTKVEAAKPYQKRNLVATNWNQSAQGLRDATKRPLAATKNFISKLQTITDLSEYLGKDAADAYTKNDKQRAVVELFRTTSLKWGEQINKFLVRDVRAEGKRQADEFYYEHPMEFLIQSVETGGKTKLELEENLRTAMSYAAFSYIAEQGGRDVMNTDEDLKAMLGMDEHEDLHPKLKEQLLTAAARQNTIFNSLGQRAIQALGMSYKGTAPKGDRSRLEATLGSYIARLLTTSVDGAPALMEEVRIPFKDMQAYRGEPITATGKQQDHVFLKMNRDANFKLAPGAQQTIDSYKGTSGVLDRLFGSEPAMKEPSFEPIEFNQKLAKNAKRKVPSYLAKILSRKNAEPSFVRQDLWNLFNQVGEDGKIQPFNPELVLEIMGHETSDALTLPARKISVDAKNASLEREYANFMEYVNGTVYPSENSLDQALYFEHQVWKQQRVGIATNMVNPQTSKFHRWMLARGDWETEVTPNGKHFESFKLRVLEGLGVKTDKQTNEKSLSQFDVMFDPELSDDLKAKDKAIARSKAVDALVARLEGQNLSLQQQRDIVDGVKAGGEKMHSLDALQAVALWKRAKGAPFKVQMMGEIDGVTNGPMLSHLLMGAGASAKALLARLNQGGFYEEGNPDSQYNVWRGKSTNQDLYESTMQKVLLTLNQMLAQKPEAWQRAADAKTLAAIQAFTGAFEDKGKIVKGGRNFIKTPLTAFVFGAKPSKASDSMAEAFIEKVYEKLEETGRSGESVAGLIAELNSLLGKYNKITANSYEGLLKSKFELSSAQVADIKNKFKFTIGAAVEATFKEEFAVLIERRDAMNAAAKASFALYNGVYQGIRARYIEELIKKGEIAPTSGGKPRHSLSQDQEDALRERLKGMAPVLHTPMSKKSGDLEAGMDVQKSARRGTDDPTYSARALFASGNVTKVDTHGIEDVAVDPGVGLAVMSVHSADSDISHTAGDLEQILNIHDAHGTGLATFEQVARNLNQATWNTLLEYSPLSEMAATLSRTIANLTELLKTTQLPEAAKEATAKALGVDQDEIGNKVLEILVEVKRQAYEADKIRLETLAQLKAVDQYAMQGGNYEVTTEDRNKAQAKLATLKPGVLDSLLNQAQDLGKAFIKKEATQADASVMTTAASAEAVADEVADMPDYAEFLMPEKKAQELLNSIKTQASASDALKKAAQQISIDLAFNRINSIGEGIYKLKDRATASLLHEAIRGAQHKVPAPMWAGLGTPKIASKAWIEDLLQSKPNISGKEMAEALIRELSKNPTDANKAQINLLAALRKTLSDSTKVVYVTSKNINQIQDVPQNAARGWFSPRGDGMVYLLSSEFIRSGLTEETVAHELLHAGLMQRLEGELTMPMKGTATHEAVNELKGLLTAAQDLVKAEGLSQKFGAAVENVHELVSWGLTNQSFQKEVLAKLNVKTQAKAATSGWQTFINAVTKLIYNSLNITKAQGNGVAVLVSSVSIIMSEQANVELPANKILSQESVDPLTESYHYTTAQIFDALADPLASNAVSHAFSEHLKEILTDITVHLHGAFGILKSNLKDQAAVTPMDVWAKAMDTGEAPFASKVAGAPFRTSAQELFVIEQLEVAFREVLNNPEAHVSVAYNELAKLYMEMRQQLQPSDFPSQEHYDFIFKPESNADGKSNYLSRFAAMGMAHGEFSLVLAKASARKVQQRTDMTVYDRLEAVFAKVMAWLNGKITKASYGEDPGTRMESLVRQLVDIEAKKRRKLAMSSPLAKFKQVEDKGLDFIEEMKMKALNLAQSDAVQNAKATGSGYVKGVAGVTRIALGGHAEKVMEGIQTLRDQYLGQQAGWATGLLNELRGAPAVVQGLIRMAKKLEQDRKRHMTDVANVVKSAFKDNGAGMSAHTQSSITNVFLRTGMHTLLTQGMSMQDLQQLLEDPTALDAAIKAELGKLGAFPEYVHYFNNQAQVLAEYLVTGTPGGPLLMMNAGNIARLHGTGVKSKLSAQETKDAETAIDVITTLYALKFTPTATINAAKEALRTEMNRTDGNGVEQLLKLHGMLDAESKARLFSGSEALMAKGYTPEIFNPHTAIQVARTEAERETLLEMGYVESEQLAQDPMDKSDPARIFVLKDGGLLPRVTGAMSFRGMASKGSKLNPNGETQDQFAWGNLGDQHVENSPARQAAVNDLFKPQRVRNPKATKGSFMAPIMNSNGEISGWRYLMRNETKDALLERDNRFDQVLGALAGSIVDKEETATQNRKVLEALKEIHNNTFLDRPESFVRIAGDSVDPEHREIWRLLPDQTKQAVAHIWGKDGMLVPYELIQPVFGYRKWSLSESFDKKDRNRLADRLSVGARQGDELNKVEELFTHMVEEVLYSIGKMKGMSADEAERYSRRGSVILRRTEQYWQTMVQLTKDIIVVKSLSVMWSNIKDNVAMMVLQGVNPVDLVKNHVVAIRGALAFRRDREQLSQLELKLNSGYIRGDEDELRAQIAVLKDAIERNPVKPLLDAGLMPTIAEDVDTGEDMHSYKAKFQRKVEGVTNKLNSNVVDAGKFIFMTHDTPLYQGLNTINQLSDFVGRYVLYQHLTTRARNPLSKADAIQMASDTFVNYDVPMHPGMQYLDDHGFMPFTKYFLRIQKVLMKLGAEQPHRVLMGTALQHFYSGIPMPTNSSLIYRFGNNPFAVGAPKFFGTLDELATVKAMGMLW